MILQTLDAYYRRKQIDPDPSKRLPSFGLEDKEIPFVLDIDEDGRLINITDTRSGEGKKKVGQHFLVPQGVKKTSGVAANLLWDTAEYALGIDTRDNPERVAEQHAAFRARIEALPDAAHEDAGIGAVRAFLDTLSPESFSRLAVFAGIQATNPIISFRLRGDLGLICQRPAVVAASVEHVDETPDGVCLVSGAPVAVERLHPSIKGVWGAQTSGANIVSFNLDAFSSYGKVQGANAPLGKAAVFAYTTALNHLLARDSRQRIQVGDASTVFWAEEAHEQEGTMADLFGDPPKDNPHKNTDAIKALYASVASGQFSVGGPGT
ncbi:type I-C CRISPR-associated protein Cas8c/Csd1, partial [Acidithiobacillus sp.]